MAVYVCIHELYVGTTSLVASEWVGLFLRRE